MAAPRLEAALSGPLALPEGAVAVVRPPADLELPFGPERAVVVSGFRPDVEAWAARGYAAGREWPEAASSVLIVPRSRALAQDLFARAVAQGPVFVDGQKTDGVDALWKAVRARLGELPAVTRGHGRAFLAPRSDAFGDWRSPAARPGPEGFVTAAGGFSEAGVDPGSRLLADHLPGTLPGHVVDLGAGWGYLTARALEKAGVERVDLVEAEADALDAARRNIADPRARFHWADARTWKSEAAAGAVLCNPPFHPGRRPDPDLGRAFISAAARMLSPHGSLWLVANRHLPYEAALDALFAEVTPLGADPRYKLIHARRPRPAPARSQRGPVT
ncbi:class I SAM-dependent methyltransferase [Histidinibacterium lentulum]|uniref:Class I SAM-dependent methyltransferase n=1 Tax=Histidinibacterium lentulum TaxID=2480588 RepID=A0A3N2R124_9RHOB|nr:methyltransferase [Histidinibacterium lentulum]ROU01177.1 class I SAM-dependent methyltransferase [Histidinibacterium lentulum]